MRPQIIIVVFFVVFLRMLLAFLKIARKVNVFPRFRRFLDYLIGLAIGEIIYAISTQDDSYIDALKTKYSKFAISKDKYSSSSGEAFRPFTTEDVSYHSSFSNQEEFKFESTESNPPSTSKAANSNIEESSPSEPQPAKTEKEDGSSTNNEAEPSPDKSDSIPAKAVEPSASEPQPSKTEKEDSSSTNNEAEPSPDKSNSIPVKIVEPPPNSLPALMHSPPKRQSSIPKVPLALAPPPPILLLPSINNKKTKSPAKIELALLTLLRPNSELPDTINLHQQKIRLSRTPQPQRLLAPSPPRLLLPSIGDRKAESPTELELALFTLLDHTPGLHKIIDTALKSLACTSPILLLPAANGRPEKPSRPEEVMLNATTIEITLNASNLTNASIEISFANTKEPSSPATPPDIPPTPPTTPPSTISNPVDDINLSFIPTKHSTQNPNLDSTSHKWAYTILSAFGLSAIALTIYEFYNSLQSNFYAHLGHLQPVGGLNRHIPRPPTQQYHHRPHHPPPLYHLASHTIMGIMLSASMLLSNNPKSKETTQTGLSVLAATLPQTFIYLRHPLTNLLTPVSPFPAQESASPSLLQQTLHTATAGAAAPHQPTTCLAADATAQTTSNALMPYNPTHSTVITITTPVGGVFTAIAHSAEALAEILRYWASLTRFTKCSTQGDTIFITTAPKLLCGNRESFTEAQACSPNQSLATESKLVTVTVQRPNHPSLILHTTLVELINFSNSHEYLLVRKSLLGSGTVITITYAGLKIIEQFPFLMIMPPPQEVEIVPSTDSISETPEPEARMPLPSRSSSSMARSVSPENSLSVGYGSSTHLTDIEGTPKTPASDACSFTQILLPSIPHLDLSQISDDQQSEQSPRTEPESPTIRLTDSQRQALHLAMLDAWRNDNALQRDQAASETHADLEQQTEQDENEIEDDIEDDASTTHLDDQDHTNNDSDIEEMFAQPSAPTTMSTYIPPSPDLVEAGFNTDLHRLYSQLQDAKESLMTLRKQRQQAEKHLSYFAEITQAKKFTRQQESNLALDLNRIETRIQSAMSEYARLMAYIKSIPKRIADMESLTQSLATSLPMSARTLGNQQLQAPPQPLTARPPQAQNSIHSKQSRIELRKALQAMLDALSEEESIFNQVKQKIDLLKGEIRELQSQKEALSTAHEVAQTNADGYRSTQANWEPERSSLRAHLPLLSSEEQRAHEKVKALKQTMRHKESMRDASRQHKSEHDYSSLMPPDLVSTIAHPHPSQDTAHNPARRCPKLLKQFELAPGILADLRDHILKLKILTKQLRASKKNSEIDPLIAKFVAELSPICSRIDSIGKFKLTPSKDSIARTLYKLKGELHVIYDQLSEKALDCIHLYKQKDYRISEREQALYGSLDSLNADIDLAMQSIQQEIAYISQPCLPNTPTSSTSTSLSYSTDSSHSSSSACSALFSSSSAALHFTLHESLNTQQIALMATQLGLSHQVIILSPVVDYMQLDPNYDITPPEVGIWNLMQDGEAHYYPALLNNHVVALYIYNWQITVIDSLADHPEIAHQVAQAFDIDDSFVEALTPNEGIQEHSPDLINACAGMALAFLDYIHLYNENNAQDPADHLPFYAPPHYEPLSTDQATTLLNLGDAITDIGTNGFLIMLALNHHMHAATVGNYISHTGFGLIYMSLQLDQLQEQ